MRLIQSLLAAKKKSKDSDGDSIPMKGSMVGGSASTNSVKQEGSLKVKVCFFLFNFLDRDVISPFLSRNLFFKPPPQQQFVYIFLF